MVKVKSYHLTHYCGGHVRYINQKQRRALHFTNDKISSSRAHDPAQWFAKSREYMHSVKRRKPCLLSSAGILKTGLLSSAPPPRFSKVPVLQWYGHPRVLGIPILFSVLPGFRGSQTLVIWASPVTLTLSLTQIGKVIWEENAHITRVLGMGMPKTRGCPYHCNTGNFSGRNQIFKSKSKESKSNPVHFVLLTDSFIMSSSNFWI